MEDSQRQDEHWTVRRQKAALCKIHNLHYDPRLTSGCTLCRKEGNVEPPAKPQFLPLLLLILALVVLIARIFVPAIREMIFPPPSTVVETNTSTAPATLNPEVFRDAITAVDSALYTNSASDLDGMRQELSTTMRRLETELARSELPNGLAAAADVRRLVDSLPPTMTLDSLNDARQSWPPVRTKNFGSADWFRHPAPKAPYDDRVAIAVYRDITASLESIAGDAVTRATTLSQPALRGFEDEAEDQRRAQEWEDLSVGWEQQINGLRSGMPERPSAGAQAKLLAAIQRLEQVLAQAGNASRSGLDGSVERWQTASQQATEARVSFEDLLYQ